MRSAVAGLSNENMSSKPASLRAALIASLMAKKTVVARPSGGSPIAYEQISYLHFTADHVIMRTVDPSGPIDPLYH